MLVDPQLFWTMNLNIESFHQPVIGAKSHVKQLGAISLVLFDVWPY